MNGVIWAYCITFGRRLQRANPALWALRLTRREARRLPPEA